MSDGSGTTAWSYDAAGHAVTERRTIAGITKTISYTYNLDGSVATITYPSGRQVAYTVSNAQRLTAAKDVASGTQYAAFASYAAPGSLQGVITGQISGGFGGVTEAHSYNSRLEYTSTQASSSNGTALNLSFNYNLPGGNNGSVSSVTNNVDVGRTETFQYDPLNRIGAASSQAASGADCWGQSFTIDALANMTQINLTQCSGTLLNVTVDGNNRFVGFGYDAVGNLTGDGTLTYSFDAENRMSAAASVNYIYDGNGLRVKKSNGTLYWRSISGDAIAESDLAGNVTGEYVFFAGRRVARRDSSGNLFYYFSDAVGNTRTITDATGHVCYDADFTPYGYEMIHTNTCPQNYKFTGYERDPETGLDYAFARYYNPRLGRFMSTDPLGGSVSSPQSLNQYAYVENNPANVADPAGMAPQCRGVSANCFGFLSGGNNGIGPNCNVDGLETPCGLFSSDATVAIPPGLSTAGFINGQAYFLRFDSDPDVNSFELFYPSLTAGQIETLGLPTEFAPGSDNSSSTQQTQSPNNVNQNQTCLAANIAQINRVSNLNISSSNLVNPPYIFNGGLNFDFSVPGAAPSDLAAGRYPSSTFNLITGIGHSLHVTSPGGADPSTYGIGQNGAFTFTTHIDSAYATWHTPVGAFIHWFVDVRDKGIHRKPC
jgi:RHS repeat-associated protein